MNSIVFFALINYALATPNLRVKMKFDNRIVGGETVSIEEYPYQLSLRHHARHFCGASIISQQWALTAAHCVSNSNYEEWTVVSNSSFQGPDKFAILHQVVEVAKHELYSPAPIIDYDIAVVKIKDSFFQVNSIAKSIRLPEYDASPPKAGDLAAVSGWGSYQFIYGPSLNELQATKLPIIERSQCIALYSYRRNVTERMLCAGLMEGGKSVCSGDSGGPLVIEGIQVGVASWTHECAKPRRPSVFADVGNLRKWIQKKTGI